MDIKKLKEVLLRAEDIVIEKVESYWNGDPTFIDETTQAEQDCVLMADEVKRLQARVDQLEAALELIRWQCPHPDEDPCPICEVADAALGTDIDEPLELSKPNKLEPTPDARELAMEIVDYVSEEEYGAIAFAEKLISIHDARLLDDAAERATAWWYSGDESAKRGVDPELDKLADELRAAVREEV